MQTTETKYRSLWTLLFISAFIILCLIYRYHHTLFYPPQSIHAWRQADCASLALNYYQHGMKFFQPEVHLLAAEGGTSGRAATSEIPLFYYLSAILYQVFGPLEFLMKAMNLLIFFGGLLYLRKLLLKLLHDEFWAATVPLLLFTSPLLVYYAGNFLTNASAFALGIIGFYHFYVYATERKRSSFHLSALFYLLAGAFKLTGLFMLFALLGYFLLERFFPGFRRIPGTALKNSTPDQSAENSAPPIFPAPAWKIWPFLAVILVVAAWAGYAARYNQRYDTTYFSTTVFPIWQLDAETMSDVWKGLSQNWLPDWFPWYTWLLIGCSGASLLPNRRFVEPLLGRLIILLVPLVLLYAALQFFTFRDHDYYLINLSILPVLVIAASIQAWMHRFRQVWKHPVAKVFFGLFLVLNIWYAQEQYQGRYRGWMNENARLLAYREIRDRLPEFGVQAGDSVICLPDGSPVALYLANRKGWTAYTDARYGRGEAIHFNQDSAGIRRSVERGARFLLLEGLDEIYRGDYLRPYTTSLQGMAEGIFVFNLRGGPRNFNPNARKSKGSLYCGLESLDSLGTRFLTSVDSILLKYGHTRSDERALEGQYAAKLSPLHPYSMEAVFPGVSAWERFRVQAWIHEAETECRIIASAADADQFYLAAWETDTLSIGDWRRVSMDFSIPEIMQGQDLHIYLYYPGQDAAYVDALEIHHFERPEWKGLNLPAAGSCNEYGPGISQETMP